MNSTTKKQQRKAKRQAINDMVVNGENIQILSKEDELREFLFYKRQY